MTVQQGHEGLLHYDFDPSRNAAQWNMNPAYRNVVPTAELATYSALAPLIHATPLENVDGILRAGTIQSYADLAASGSPVVADRLKVKTDEFDISLGLHNFSFWNLGRAHVESGSYGAYFIADNDLLDDSLVGFHDIADFGALVSPEHQAEYQRELGLTDGQVKARNDEATRRYFAELFNGSDFREIFAKYVSVHHDQLRHYFTDMYHFEDKGDEGLIMRDINTFEVAMRMAWPGPQVILPGSTDLEHVKTILLADFNYVEVPDAEERRIARLARNYGIEVVRMTDYVREGLSHGSEKAIVAALKRLPDGAIAHTVLNFAINTLGGAIESAEQEAERLELADVRSDQVV